MGFLTADPKARWTDNIIPYNVADDILIDDVARRAVERAINEWNNHTFVQLVPRTTENNFAVFIKDSRGCNSPVGRRSGMQFIRCRIGTGPFNALSVMHEIGHALGMFHEHQRPDRDAFVAVTPAAIDTSPENYRIERGTIFTQYDCNSIMHYQNNPGMITNQPGVCLNMGMGTGLSPLDILTANSLELGLNPANEMIAASDGQLYVLQQGAVYRYLGRPHKWEEVANNPANRAIVASGNNLYVLQDGRIYRYLGSPHNWEEVADNESNRMIAAGGNNLYVLQDGRIYRYLGSPHNWLELDSEPNNRSIFASNDDLYSIQNNGRIVRSYHA
jgi:hypothetical protein